MAPKGEPHPLAPIPRVSLDDGERQAFDPVASFGSSSDYGIGVEEEMMVLDPETFSLAIMDEGLDGLIDGSPDRFKRELARTTFETATPACSDVNELERLMCEGRRRALQATDRRLAVAGSHPFQPDRLPISDGLRYSSIEAEYAWVAWSDCTFGMHVHVAVPGAKRALKTFNVLRSYMPEVAALASNSPFHLGQDTGLASIRLKMTERFPRSGVPPAWESWKQLGEFIEWGRQSESFVDHRHFWWDVRPHLGFGTLEMRIMDAQTSVQDAVAIATFARVLVRWLAQRLDEGEPLPVHRSARIEENRWRALRWGLTGYFVDLDTGEQISTRARLAGLIDALEEVADPEEASRLTWARVMLAGNGAERQRRIAEDGGIDAVLPWLASRTQDLTV